MTTPRELWLLNFYRNSELHGALLMGRLARSFRDAGLAANLTRHCATEARHAAMFTDTIAALGGVVDLDTGTMQERYGDAGGRPAALLDLLVLSEILEKRVLASYRAHLARTDVHENVRATLQAIVREMEAEEDGGDPHAGWIDRALDAMPAAAVARAKARWREIDERVAGALSEWLESQFSSVSGVTSGTKQDRSNQRAERERGVAGGGVGAVPATARRVKRAVVGRGGGAPRQSKK